MMCYTWDMVNAVAVMVMVMACPEGVILEMHCPSYIPMPIAIETVW